jgi:integrase
LVRKAGRTWTVEQWLTHWVENIAAPFVRENTIAGYRVAEASPGSRGTRAHLEKLYVRMMKNGSAPATAHQAHRTIRTALNEAVRRGHLARNPSALAKAPRLPETEVEPYSVDEIRLLLQSALAGRNGARWAVALALGLRQGEALGLGWDDVDLDAGTLLVRRGRLRPRWEHGCNGTCGRKFGGYCPNRVALRDETAETKSRAGRRRIGLPDQLVELLRTHRAEQDRERAKAGQLWTDDGWVFASPTGAPLNPRTDWTDWKKLHTRAGVRDGRLHDARHTAATVLLLLGVPERAVMGVMGWSNTAMAARYQHITAAVQRDIAGRVGGLIWQASGEPADDKRDLK